MGSFLDFTSFAWPKGEHKQGLLHLVVGLSMEKGVVCPAKPGIFLKKSVKLSQGTVVALT